MKRSGWTKLAAIAVVVVLLAIMLARIGFLVDERSARQDDAVRSVQRSLAGAQTLLGPWLQRSCVEEWTTEAGQGAERRPQTQRREFLLDAGPQSLSVSGEARPESRHRGLFKVNGYLASLQAQAQWPSLAALVPQPQVAGSRLRCGPVVAMLAVTDPRGVQRAQVELDGRPLTVAAGTRHPVHAQGLHASFEPASFDAPVQLQVTLDLRGTGRLDLVPAAGQTEWRLRSSWAHPSFVGHHLPAGREVGEAGFQAVWRVSALASSALRDVVQGGRLCAGEALEQASETAAVAPAGPPRCLDTLGVAFVDPVNPYVLADRAVKYGLLFVVLTFVAVALAEVLAGPRMRRVHPVQYALVGVALGLFFLLLLALSEHLPFVAAYAAASVACVAVLGLYGVHLLDGRAAGAAFAGGLALLYGLLYVLLTREQSALVIGAVGLFAALAAVMLLTRHVDWYRRLDDVAVGRQPPGRR